MVIKEYLFFLGEKKLNKELNGINELDEQYCFKQGQIVSVALIWKIWFILGIVILAKQYILIQNSKKALEYAELKYSKEIEELFY